MYFFALGSHFRIVTLSILFFLRSRTVDRRRALHHRRLVFAAFDQRPLCRRRARTALRRRRRAVARLRLCRRLVLVVVGSSSIDVKIVQKICGQGRAGPRAGVRLSGRAAPRPRGRARRAAAAGRRGERCARVRGGRGASPGAGVDVAAVREARSSFLEWSGAVRDVCGVMGRGFFAP